MTDSVGLLQAEEPVSAVAVLGRIEGASGALSEVREKRRNRLRGHLENGTNG
jgi:hypothetical protein